LTPPTTLTNIFTPDFALFIDVLALCNNLFKSRRLTLQEHCASYCFRKKFSIDTETALVIPLLSD
jgi:hypothetical protein